MENLKDKKTISPELKTFYQKTQVMKEHVSCGRAENVNEAFKKFDYSIEGHKVLKTVLQWNKDGKQVIKGSKALYLWSTPPEKEKKK